MVEEEDSGEIVVCWVQESGDDAWVLAWEFAWGHVAGDNAGGCEAGDVAWGCEAGDVSWGHKDGDD